jgi:hypothetical protein
MVLTSGANPNFQNKVRVHVCNQLYYHDFKLDDHSANSVYDRKVFHVCISQAKMATLKL